MEATDGHQDTVHPEVRAHVNSLVSALGGLGGDDDGQYQLGDDALEVLRDLKRWIRFYDEKTNRMDVARCIYDANLVEGDLLPILVTWPESESQSKFKARIALACFEVMTSLTWPMDRDKERMTVNHHRHLPVLELAQVAYKRAIINFDGVRILHSAVRTALPSVAQPIGDRTARDQGIIKLVLFFLRNMAMIVPPPGVKYDGEEAQISRSATIDAFSFQDIFLFLLTIASNMGEEFRTEDTTVMEIIYHLVRRVEPQELFMSAKQLDKSKANELSAMMQKESAMLKAHNRKGPTRHNRFGTMIWVKRNGNKMTSLSGQDALTDASLRDQKMDSSKTFRPPRRNRIDEKRERDWGPKPKLNARANSQLRSFTEDFLDSGFNPLFSHIRKTIDREPPHLMDYHRRQFFYVVAWFLEAERARKKSVKDANKTGTTQEVGSFNLVAGVLNQEMFVTMNRTLHEAYDNKDHHELAAVMRCFTQILLTVQEMSASGNDEDEEIAENILSRLFYEESTHDIIANIIRNYKDQAFDYLDAATELVHHFLRILESYAKQNVDMQVRSRKRVRQKKKDQQGAEGGQPQEQVDEEDDSADEEQNAQKITKERKFDFHRFASRFTPQGVVDAFVTFTKFYQDLTEAQLKRAHRYFYRVAFKQEMSVMLFRVDIVQLFYNLIKGTEPLEKSSGVYREWEELVKQVLRKCTKRMEERPELIVEMLFSKFHGVATFLEHGHLTASSSSAQSKAKPAVELVFKHTEELDKQIAIAVGALLDKNQADNIGWVKSILIAVESERRAWEALDEAAASAGDVAADEETTDTNKEASVFVVRPDSKDRQIAMYKNSHLRLLMKLCSFRLAGPESEETFDAVWVVPSHATASQLADCLHYINQAEFSPPTFEDGKSAEQRLKRKTLARKKAAFDDDESGEEDDEILFPAGGPTAMSFIDDSEQGRNKKAKSGKRRRRVAEDGEGPDEAVLEERARKRRDKEREKVRKIKSALYVKEGDDEFDSEEDEAFFARERAIAAKARQAAETALESLAAGKDPSAAAAKGKRKSTVLDSSSDEGGDDGEIRADADIITSSKSVTQALDSSQQTDGAETDDTPMSTVGSDTSAAKRRKLTTTRPSKAKGLVVSDDDEDMSDASAAGEATNLAQAKVPSDADVDLDEDEPVLGRRSRVRGGFVIDSSDEE